jgi:hypothetical protein
MSFSSFNFEALPVTPSNKTGFLTPSPSTHNLFSHSALETYCFNTPRASLATPIGVPSHSRGSKRRKENEGMTDKLPSLNRPSKKRKTVRDKLDSIFIAIKNENLTFGEFIYLVSRNKDEKNQSIPRSQTHATVVVLKDAQFNELNRRIRLGRLLNPLDFAHHQR